MNAHTPGPWTVSALDPRVVGGVRILSVPALEAVVPQLQAVARMMERTGETDANARLIAAAPDLLEACIQMRDAIDSQDADHALASCRAAIAKAEDQ